MKLKSKLYVFILFSLILSLLISIIFFAKESYKDKYQELSRFILDDFHKALKYENADLLSFSLALSENGSLKNALISDDEQLGFDILSAITKRFKEYTHIKTLRLQLIDNEFFIFAQSWGNASAGMPIWWFRDDLEKLKKSRKPKVSIETGRLLTFKATIPLQFANKNIGYLEVIKFVDEFSKKLHKRGLEFFVLMHKQYLDQASLMQDFPYLDQYIISNQNYNQQLKIKASIINWDELELFGNLYDDNTLYILEPMYNGDRQEIGKYLIIVPPKSIASYKKRYQDVSMLSRFTDKDISVSIELLEKSSSSYKNFKDKNLMQWLPKLHKEDKAALINEAKRMLDSYSKDELIDIILENKHNEKKIGSVI